MGITTENIPIEVITQVLNGVSDNEIVERFHITKETIETLKKIVGNSLPSIFSETKPVSKAIRFFLNLIEKREFTEYLTENFNFTPSQCSHVHSIVTGRVRPTYGVIYALREQIAPVEWYYLENEECPSPISFIPKYTNYSPDTWKDFAKKDTCGHVFFNYIRNANVYTYFCEDNEMEKTFVNNYVYMKKRVNGERRYHTRPSFPFINTIKKELHPDFWYLFPDEVPSSHTIIQKIAEKSIALHTR